VDKADRTLRKITVDMDRTLQDVKRLEADNEHLAAENKQLAARIQEVKREKDKEISQLQRKSA
jgi:cell division protein FtsB